MIRSTTIKANEKTIKVVSRMAEMKDSHRRKIIEKINQSKVDK